MQRLAQSLQELLDSLSPMEVDWLDDHAWQVIAALRSIPDHGGFDRDALEQLLEGDFEAGMTAIRLFLDLSKDEFTSAVRNATGANAIANSFRADRRGFLEGLIQLGVLEQVDRFVTTPVSWVDVLVERSKSGRGSAIRGQKRGRLLEDFAESIVRRVFGDLGYEARVRFVGASGSETEKADFAIPNRHEPRVLIEAKAYGATGSKQTDVLGDVDRIIAQKRLDTTFLLLTDGLTWRDRTSDLRKLVERQNQGRIARIYTMAMARQLEEDLWQLKNEYFL